MRIRGLGRLPRVPRVALACSSGGHLDQLLALVGDDPGTERVWVTAPGPSVARLRAAGDAVVEIDNPGRSPLRLVRNVAQALRALALTRPDAVVTSPANVSVAFCLLARLSGRPLIVVESVSRTHRLSLSGRLLRPAATRIVVHWPALKAHVPEAFLGRPPLFDAVVAGPVARGTGTFVTFGTHDQPFDRLLRLVDDAAAAGVLPAPVEVQAGPPGGYRPRAVSPRAMTPEEHRRRLEGCDVLVCHAGAGLIATALRARRRPLVLPRRGARGEHVDDHQADLARELAALGLVVDLEGVPAADAVARAHAPLPAAPAWGGDSAQLVRDALVRP